MKFTALTTGVALLLAAGFAHTAQAQSAAPAAVADPAKVDAIVAATFAKASDEWRKRMELDDPQRLCTQTRNQPTAKEADALQAREAANVVMPADGKFLGDWKSGFKIANDGRGGQFSDPPGTVSGGNCYACHQMDPKELSYGTLGPSLAGYGRDRKYDPEVIKEAWRKIYNSQAVVACSNMPRFGSMKILTEAQIKDVMAYLFDPESPVNK